MIYSTATLGQNFGKALKRRYKVGGFKDVLRRRQDIGTGEYMLSEAQGHENPTVGQGGMLFLFFPCPLTHRALNISLFYAIP